MAVGLETTTLLVVKGLVESFCHVLKGSWGMVYRCTGLKHANYLSCDASHLKKDFFLVWLIELISIGSVGYCWPSVFLIEHMTCCHCILCLNVFRKLCQQWSRSCDSSHQLWTTCHDLLDCQGPVHHKLYLQSFGSDCSYAVNKTKAWKIATQKLLPSSLY